MIGDHSSFLWAMEFQAEARNFYVYMDFFVEIWYRNGNSFTSDEDTKILR